MFQYRTNDNENDSMSGSVPTRSCSCTSHAGMRASFSERKLGLKESCGVLATTAPRSIWQPFQEPPSCKCKGILQRGPSVSVLRDNIPFEKKTILLQGKHHKRFVPTPCRSAYMSPSALGRPVNSFCRPSPVVSPNGMPSKAPLSDTLLLDPIVHSMSFRQALGDSCSPLQPIHPRF